MPGEEVLISGSTLLTPSSLGLKSKFQVQYSVPLAPDPPGDQFPSQMDLATVNLDWDIREQIRALPTKADIQQ